MPDQSKSTADPNNLPVWDVYDEYRTARLNIKYYSCLLERTKKLNFWVEFILAFTASAAVVAFNFWKTEVGASAWQMLSILSAILAVLKPLLRLTDRIRALEEIVTGFSNLFFDLKRIVLEIKQDRCYTDELQKQFLAAMERTRELLAKGKDGHEDKKLILRFWQNVLQELPFKNFYIPPTRCP